MLALSDRCWTSAVFCKTTCTRMHFILCVDVFHRILVVFWDVTPVMHLHSIWLHNQQQRRRRRCNIKVGEVIISVSRRSCQHAARAHEWSGDIGLSCTTTSSTCPAAVRRPRGDGTVTRTCPRNGTVWYQRDYDVGDEDRVRVGGGFIN